MGDSFNQRLQRDEVQTAIVPEPRRDRLSDEVGPTKKSLLPPFPLKTLEDLKNFDKSLQGKKGPKIEKEFVSFFIKILV